MKINKEIVLNAMKKQNIPTQAELAERMGMSSSTISQMLSTSYEPIKNNVLKLMEELFLTYEELTSPKSISENYNKKVDQITFIETKNTKINRFDYMLTETVDSSKVKPKNRYTVLETFAGAGGLALGFELAGLDNVGSIEIDKDATNTLRENRPKWNVLNEDINKVVQNEIKRYDIFKNIEELDVLTGGFPCQSFSYAGKGAGFADTRGTLFYPYSILIEQLQPKMFVAENVKGLVNHDNGKTLTTMIQIFESKGYNIYWNVLNSWNYETAQKRERIIIIGVRNDLVLKESYSYAYPRPYDFKPVLKDVIASGDVPESEGVDYSEKKYKVLDLVPPGGCWVDLPEQIAKEYLGASWNSGGGKRGMARRMSWNEPSLTLTTSPNQKQTERCHPDETRPFTVREYARIQGFPDDWVFCGSVYSKYKQIGNAVPVNLAKNIGLSIVYYLNQFKNEEHNDK